MNDLADHALDAAIHGTIAALALGAVLARLGLKMAVRGTEPVTAADIAALLKDYGPWGLVGLFGVVIVYLHKGWQACQEARIVDARLGTEALSGVTTTPGRVRWTRPGRRRSPP